MSSHVTLGWLGFGILALASCSAHVAGDTGQSSSTTDTGGSGGSTSVEATGGATTGSTTSSTTAGSTTTSSAGTGGAPVDAGAPDPIDGTPTRQACTGNFGSALSASHGRLDGYLVSIVQPGGSKACNGDTDHVHLQVRVNGAIYDVAINTDVLYAELDAPLPGGAWAEGWHAGMSLDYPSSLGLHSSGFTTTNPTALAQKVSGELANVNHIAVFATGYGPTGAHDVHRRGYSEDGLIAIDPLSAKPHLLAFRFTTDSF